MIVSGRITDANPRTLTIQVPYDPRFVTQQWDEVQVDIPDGRRISPEQRRKIYALMGEIATWAGMDREEVKLTVKHDFVQRHLEGLHKELFSLSFKKTADRNARPLSHNVRNIVFGKGQI